VTAIAAALAVATAPLAGANKRDDLLKFAAEMAEHGNWREARYRWEQVAVMDPENPRVLNNLAVAYEAMGDHESAARYYQEAEKLAPDEPAIRDNSVRSRRFWGEVGGTQPDFDPIAARAALRAPDSKGKKKSKGAIDVQVSLPVPPRLDIGDRKTILIASFLGREEEVMDDADREFARFLRSEFRRGSGLDVLDIIPPPAIPEQTIDDLIVNSEFWKHLGRRYEADLVVSGAVSYDSRDLSGYKQVDVISEATGQKIRETRFVEQEEFSYRITLLFFDGASGELLFRDTLSRRLVFAGAHNDPMSAFFEISSAVASDILSVVAPRRRIDSRMIFRSS
jgi:hypothetical protein